MNHYQKVLIGIPHFPAIHSVETAKAEDSLIRFANIGVIGPTCRLNRVLNRLESSLNGLKVNLAFNPKDFSLSLTTEEYFDFFVEITRFDTIKNDVNLPQRIWSYRFYTPL